MSTPDPRRELGPVWWRGQHLSTPAGEHLPPDVCFGCEIERLEAEVARLDREVGDLRRQLAFQRAGGR